MFQVRVISPHLLEMRKLHFRESIPNGLLDEWPTENRSKGHRPFFIAHEGGLQQ